MISRLSRLLWIGGWLLASAAWGGSGRIGTDGNIDLTVNVRFPIPPAALTDLRLKLRDASQVLWDATEGQMRLRRVKITCTPVNEDLADFWVFPGNLRSSSCVDCLTRRGGHVNQNFTNPGEVYAHEFGHLGLGLGDEYPEDVTSCGGKGPCISENPPEHSDVNQCLMQQISLRDHTELCVRANHDPLRGDNTSCRLNPPFADGAPCAGSCQVWNLGTRRIETSNQSMINNGESCWETLVRKFPFLKAPLDRPEATAPAGFTDPEFQDLCRAADTVTLLLDTSTSMEVSVNGPGKEVCGNKFDDDKDGKVDEKDDCTQSRMEFVKAAARSLIGFNMVTSFRVNLVSFDSSVREHVAFMDAALGASRFIAAVDVLRPGGLTAIGDALSYSRSLLEVEPASASRVVFLITDGDNSTGPDPRTEIPAYQAAGIRIFPIGTGDAVNSRALREITTATRGTMLEAADPSSLVTTMAEQWATYTNVGLLLPQRTYAVSRTGEGQGLPPRTSVSFRVETGMRRYVAMLAGSLGDMSGFGVRALLRSPSGAVLDSTVPPPELTVTQDRFFTFLALDRPEPGVWEIEISGLPTAAPIQTGRLIVLADHPDTDLFADIDKTVMTSATDKAELTLMPYYFTGLADVDWEVRLRRPDGSVAPVAVAPGLTPYVYHATVSGFPVPGSYDLEITLRTRPGTTNDPGESRPGTAPPNTRPVPLLERHLRIPLLRPANDSHR